VVARVAATAVGSPINGAIEIAGPEPLGIDELVRRLFAVTGDGRTVTSDPNAGYFGAVLDDSALTPTLGANAWIAPTTFDEWLRDRS
jgi:uncharacterized protein YbjT (DUF2867 family)